MKFFYWLILKIKQFFSNPVVEEVLNYAIHELKNLAKFFILMVIAIGAHAIVGYLETLKLDSLKFFFQFVEYAVLILAVIEYLGGLAKAVWKNLQK